MVSVIGHDTKMGKMNIKFKKLDFDQFLMKDIFSIILAQ